MAAVHLLTSSPAGGGGPGEHVSTPQQQTVAMIPRVTIVSLVLMASVKLGAALSSPPPGLIALDFVPNFSFRTRVVALDPAPAAGTENTSVLTVFVWGWGQPQSQTVGVGSWGPQCNFTRNETGAYWGALYPNTYGLRTPLHQGFHKETILVTHLFVCHGGSFPCSNSLTCGRDPNQTTTVEVEVTVGGKTSTLQSTLKWGAEGTSAPPHCDDLGIIVGQETKTGEHFVETFQQYNARKYWPSFDALPKPRSTPTKFALMDGFRTSDCDMQAARDALRATQKLGLHGSQFGGSAVAGSGIPGGSAWLQKQEVGYALTAAGGNVALLEYATGAPNTSPTGHYSNLSDWAHGIVDPLIELGFEGNEIRNTPIHDEPTMSIPRDFPPVGNPSHPEVSARWVKYLTDQGLSPSQLGASTWGGVKPGTAGYHRGSSLEARRLYYHSVRFVAWDSSRYLAQATRSLESLLAPEATIFVNWNNMASHWYFPTPAGTGYVSHDWFQHARERGGTQLWTEDWFGDGQSWQWSYYAALMSRCAQQPLARLKLRVVLDSM